MCLLQFLNLKNEHKFRDSFREAGLTQNPDADLWVLSSSLALYISIYKVGTLFLCDLPLNLTLPHQ